MARTKKLTDPIYSPTNPTSEAAIRAQIDDSIQEVYDQSSRNDATVNLTGNQTIAGVKTFSSSPIVPTPTTSTQVANKAYVDGVAISATIPLDSLTDDYLTSAPGNIKPRVATLETDFSTAQTDITNLETDINIITSAVSDTGLVNAMVVNTASTFDMAKNGNVTPFIIPLFTNTGTATLSIDGGAVTGIRKANDSGTLVVLEAGDIKKNVPTQFVLDTVSGFFVYAPKGGSNIKSIQRGEKIFTNTETTVNIPITSISTTKSIVLISFTSSQNGEADRTSVRARITSATNLELVKQTGTSNTNTFKVAWQVIEFNNVKSLQTGTVTMTGNDVWKDTNVTITSVNALKSISIVTMYTNGTSTSSLLQLVQQQLTTNTNLKITSVAATGTSQFYAYQVIEFV